MTSVHYVVEGKDAGNCWRSISCWEEPLAGGRRVEINPTDDKAQAVAFYDRMKREIAAGEWPGWKAVSLVMVEEKRTILGAADRVLTPPTEPPAPGREQGGRQ